MELYIDYSSRKVEGTEISETMKLYLFHFSAQLFGEEIITG
jgi:hypothetical protein